LAAFADAARAQGLDLLEEYSYHPATRSTFYKEDWPEDSGGVLYGFVKNNGTAADGLAALEINGNPAADYDGIRWWRAWPPTLQPGEVGWFSIKATDAPLAAGAEAKIAWASRLGWRTEATVRCAPVDLRIANVLPSPGMDQLLLYLRNDGSNTLTIASVAINASQWTAASPELEAVGGSFEVPAGGLRILKLRPAASLRALAPLALRVQANAEAGPQTAAVGMRLVQPEFPIGTWSTDLPKEPEAMAFARKVGVDFAMTGLRWEQNAAMRAKFGIRTMHMPSVGDPKQPDVEVIKAQAANTDIAVWMVRDEPDLNGKPSRTMLEHNQEYWNYDAHHPTFLNLMTTAAFNEYGHIADIAGMDHYVMFAPNSIPWTGVTRSAAMEEAIEYTEQLKANTEPHRMWVWAQLAAGVWNRQPLSWGVDYQFWAHVMTGAKGILWFKYGPGTENSYTPQYQEGERLAAQLNAVRTACFYGEPQKNLVSDNPKVIGRTLVSESSVVAIALNNDYEIGGLPVRPRYTQNSSEATLTIPVPAWVPVERVRQITSEGATPVAFENVEGGIQIKAALAEDSLVYLIGQGDTTAPTVPSGLNVAHDTPETVVLAWEASSDDTGTAGYTLYRDGEKVGDFRAPVVVMRGDAIQPGQYTVAAWDIEGNRSAASPPVPLAR